MSKERERGKAEMRFTCGECGHVATVRGPDTPAGGRLPVSMRRCPECNSTRWAPASAGGTQGPRYRRDASPRRRVRGGRRG